MTLASLLRGAVLALLLMTALASAAAAREFVDSAGRKVQVPDRVERVFAAGHPAGIALYSLAPDLLLGWTRRLPEAARAYMPAKYFALPMLGRLTGRGDTANIEVVLKHRPDVIVDYGSAKPTYVSLADRLQAKTGIPVVLIDGTFAHMPEGLRMLGDLTGRRERAERLARYAETTLARARRTVAGVPAGRRPTVYYGRGADGLESGREGSINVEALDHVGAENVAARTGRGGLATISIEQVLMWNPEVIVTIDPNFYNGVKSNPQWAGVGAVRDGRVYMAPELPFRWFDAPPSVNRLIGVPWLLHLFYPERMERPLRDEVAEFYELFWHQRPTPAQLDALLAEAFPKEGNRRDGRHR
jgi:iron complex transport system substrate-binding protein